MVGRQITIRVSPSEFQRLRREASARHVTLSSYVRRAICEYLELKHELAETLSSDGGRQNGGAPAPRIIHSLLARSEERIAATIDGQAERISHLRDDMRTLAAMIDRAYLSYLAHTPEVDLQLRGAALASGRRRHAAWLMAVEDFLRAGGGDPAAMIDREGETS
jgi:hypothetical protein